MNDPYLSPVGARVTFGKKKNRSLPPRSTRPPTEAGQTSGAIVVATGQETSPSVTGADQMTVEADLSSLTDAIDDLMAIVRVHERTDGAASSVPTDQWGPGEAYFVRTADDGDTTASPDKLRVQLHRHYGGNTGYTVKVDWAVFSTATAATVASGQESTTATAGTVKYEWSVPVSTTVGMEDLVPLVRVHQGRDGYDDALAAPVWVVADSMFTRSDGNTTSTLPPENITFRVYVESGTASGTVYMDYLILDGTQGSLLESAETSSADGVGRTSAGSYKEWDFSTAPSLGQEDLILWIRSHEFLDGSSSLGDEYARPANYLFDNDPDDTTGSAVPDGVSMFWAGSASSNWRQTAYALSKTAEIAAQDPEVAAYSHTHTESDVTDLDHVVRVEKAGSTVGTRGGINFIEGSNVTLTVTDDSGNDEVDVTIAASGGGGGGVTVIAQGVDSFTVSAQTHERTIDLSSYSITTPINALTAVLRVHERQDGSTSTGGGDIWHVAEAWFLRDADDADTTQPPDDLRYRIHKVQTGAPSYTIYVDWTILG